MIENISSFVKNKHVKIYSKEPFYFQEVGLARKGLGVQQRTKIGLSDT